VLYPALEGHAAIFPLTAGPKAVENIADQVLIRSARSTGASRSFIFRKTILPAAAPEIFTGIRLGGSYCVMAVAEMTGATAGLGYLVIYSQETFNVPEMYAGIVGLAISGLGLNFALHTIEGRFTSWRRDIRTGE
jgi:NitT/TauT family transport system permease protein